MRKQWLKPATRGALDVEEKTFAVTRAELDLKLVATRIEVLEEFTKNEQLATLEGGPASCRCTAQGQKKNESLRTTDACNVLKKKSCTVP